MLEVAGVHAHYGESHILHDVSLNVNEGETVAVLGRNGAGKTTTLKTIMGYVPATGGDVRMNGRSLTGIPTYRAVRGNIGYVPENRGIFKSLTVREHIALAASLARKPLGGALERALALFPRLAERVQAQGDSLSGGEQQMLSIARALVSEPKLLILDEPSEGLAPVIITDLEKRLLDVKHSGQSILIVEQNYRLATAIADRVYVIGDGWVRFEGTCDALEATPDVKQKYLGI